MFYRYKYFPAPPSQVFQGTQEQLAKKLKRNPDLHVIAGRNGSYRLAGTSSGTIYEYPDENSANPTRSITPSKDMIRLRYGKSNVTEKDYRSLTAELNNGTIQFDSLDKPPRF